MHALFFVVSARRSPRIIAHAQLGGWAMTGASKKEFETATKITSARVIYA
jgi:hypothetical protein